MTFYHRVKSYARFLKVYVDFLRLFRKRYRNYKTVIFKFVRGCYPIAAVLRTGQNITLQNYRELYGSLLNLNCDFQKDLVYVDGLLFYGGVSNADSVCSFIAKEYEFLPVKDKVVIDIGANIGDSSIFFALKGARRVIAIEPDLEVCKFANKNIESNGFANIIQLVKAACGCSDIIRDTKTSLLTLDRIIGKCTIKPSILKIDCEGCEYDIVLRASPQTLLNFSHIQIEYHHGYANLKKKLEDCGFHVEISGPNYFISVFSKSTTNRLFSSDNDVSQVDKTYSGMIYAVRL